jgi:hypothetical protein
MKKTGASSFLFFVLAIALHSTAQAASVTIVNEGDIPVRVARLMRAKIAAECRLIPNTLAFRQAIVSVVSGPGAYQPLPAGKQESAKGYEVTFYTFQYSARTDSYVGVFTGPEKNRPVLISMNNLVIEKDLATGAKRTFVTQNLESDSSDVCVNSPPILW